MLLRWLTYARSPPSLGELAEAAIVNPAGAGEVDLDNRGGIEDTVEILAGLVTLERTELNDEDSDYGGDDDFGSDMPDSEDGSTGIAPPIERVREDAKVRLAHFSVKEYLESKRVLQSNAKDFYLESAKEHEFLAQSCLTYLMHYSGSDEKTSTKQDLRVFPLLEYAARSWFYHASLQQCGEVSRETSLLSSEGTKHDWLLIHQPDRSWARPFEGLKGIAPGLYYASCMGLERAVGELLKIGADVNVQGGTYGNALQAASAGGHEKVVSILMNGGADVNVQGGDYGNASTLR